MQTLCKPISLNNCEKCKLTQKNFNVVVTFSEFPIKDAHRFVGYTRRSYPQYHRNSIITVTSSVTQIQL